MGASQSSPPPPGSCVVGNTTTYAGRSCSMQCGIDYPGGDYKQMITNDYLGCLEACASDPVCTDSQFDQQNNNCFLKSTLTSTPRALSYIDSAVCTTQGAGACSASVLTVTASASTPPASTVSSVVTSTQTITTTASAPAQSTVTQTITSTASAPAQATVTSTQTVTSTASAATVTISHTVTSISSTTTTAISTVTNTVSSTSFITSTVTTATTVSTCSGTSTTFSSSIVSSASPTSTACSLPQRSNSGGIVNGGFENGFTGWTYSTVHGTVSESVISSYAIEGCKYLQLTPSGATANDNATFGQTVTLTSSTANLVFSYGSYANQTLPSDNQIQVFVGGFSLGIFPVCVGSSCGISYAGVNWATLTVSIPAIPAGQNFTGFLQIDALWQSNDPNDSSILFDDFHLTS